MKKREWLKVISIVSMIIMLIGTLNTPFTLISLLILACMGYVIAYAYKKVEGKTMILVFSMFFTLAYAVALNPWDFLIWAVVFILTI